MNESLNFSKALQPTPKQYSSCFMYFAQKSLYLAQLYMCIVFFATICQVQNSRTITRLEEYIVRENRSYYSVFNTFTPRRQQFYKQNFPQLEKLIYVTPWNPQGQELTLKYAHKLDYVIPCWYELVFKKQHILVDSDANYNESYIEMLRSANHKIKILPRVSIMGSRKSIIQAIGSIEGRFKRAISLIATLINKQKVDGLVIDTPYNLFLRDSANKFEDDQQLKSENVAIKNLLVQLVNSIRINLFKKKLIFYSIPNPSQYMNELSSQRFAMLHVDGFLVQAFDNIQYDQQLKSAITWTRMISGIKTNTNTKYFILLPFFSRRQRQGIRTSQVLKALLPNGLVYQSIQNSICMFLQAKSHVKSYVPCYKYFKQCFNKIQNENDIHVGFWQAGDGLENYFLFM